MPPTLSATVLRAPIEVAASESSTAAPRLKALLRPAAFFHENILQPTRAGGSRVGPVVDVPHDAPWAQESCGWGSDPFEAPTPLLQLNLEEAPASVRGSDWPVAGVLWLVMDTMQVRVLYDPRPARKIVWRHRWKRAGDSGRGLTEGAGAWSVHPTLPCRSTAPDKGLWDLASARLAQLEKSRPIRPRSLVQLGGWVGARGPAFLTQQKDLVCSVLAPALPVGADSCVNLRYNVQKGFYADTVH